MQLSRLQKRISRSIPIFGNFEVVSSLKFGLEYDQAMYMKGFIVK
jgi:hypothetical protein